MQIRRDPFPRAGGACIFYFWSSNQTISRVSRRFPRMQGLYACSQEYHEPQFRPVQTGEYIRYLIASASFSTTSAINKPLRTLTTCLKCWLPISKISGPAAACGSKNAWGTSEDKMINKCISGQFSSFVAGRFHEGLIETFLLLIPYLGSDFLLARV